MLKKLLYSTIAAAGAVVVLAVPAAAHVTTYPDEGAQGGYSIFAFRVPNEDPAAGTVKVEVSLPAEHEIGVVLTQPVSGWTAEVVREDDVVRQVIWTADPGLRIDPGEYQEFGVAVGPLPTDTDVLVMPTKQTYDSGEVVAWDDPPPAEGAAEPEYPAPVLRLLPQAEGTSGHGGGTDGVTVTGTSAAPATDSAARWLGGAGLVLGALGLGLGAGAVLRLRRGGSA